MKYKQRSRLREVFFWLFIFIVGSLIVHFLIYPETFESFKENAKEKISIDNVKKYVRLSDNVTLPKFNSQESLEFQAEYTCETYNDYALLFRITKDEMKDMECNSVCSRNRLYYSHYSCINHKLICKCDPYLATSFMQS